MTLHDSKESFFEIEDTGTTLRDMSGYLVAVDGLPGPRELNDASVLSSSGRQWHPTLEAGVITLELLWDETASTGPDAVFGPLRTHTVATTFSYGPQGNTASEIKYSGECWVRNYQITSRVGSIVTARVELNVDGVVTRGTY